MLYLVTLIYFSYYIVLYSMNMSQISNSTVDRHLGYFQIFITMSNAAINRYWMLAYIWKNFLRKLLRSFPEEETWRRNLEITGSQGMPIFKFTT